MLKYFANVIAENLYFQVDDEGYNQVMLDEIIDHKLHRREVHSDDTYVIHNDKKHQCKTTKGWKLCVQWKDGSTSWEPLVNMINAYSIVTEEYIVVDEHQAAFSWWVCYMVKQKNA